MSHVLPSTRGGAVGDNGTLGPAGLSRRMHLCGRQRRKARHPGRPAAGALLEVLIRKTFRCR